MKSGQLSPGSGQRRMRVAMLLAAVLTVSSVAVNGGAEPSPAAAQSYTRGTSYSVTYAAPGPCTNLVDRKVGEYALSASSQNAWPHKAGSEYRGQIADAYVARQYTKVYTRSTYVKWSECRNGKYYNVLYLGKPITRCWAAVYQNWGNVPVYSSASFMNATTAGHVSGKGPCPL